MIKHELLSSRKSYRQFVPISYIINLTKTVTSVKEKDKMHNSFDCDGLEVNILDFLICLLQPLFPWIIYVYFIFTI